MIEGLKEDEEEKEKVSIAKKSFSEVNVGMNISSRIPETKRNYQIPMVELNLRAIELNNDNRDLIDSTETCDTGGLLTNRSVMPSGLSTILQSKSGSLVRPKYSDPNLNNTALGIHVYEERPQTQKNIYSISMATSLSYAAKLRPPKNIFHSRKSKVNGIERKIKDMVGEIEEIKNKRKSNSNHISEIKSLLNRHSSKQEIIYDRHRNSIRVTRRKLTEIQNNLQQRTVTFLNKYRPNQKESMKKI